MKKYLAIMLLGLSLTFISCGSDGDTQEGGLLTKILIVDCNGSNSADALNDCNTTTSYYTCLQSGDTIVNETNDTNVSIIHDINNNKEVCTLSGEAYILR